MCAKIDTKVIPVNNQRNTIARLDRSLLGLIILNFGQRKQISKTLVSNSCENLGMDKSRIYFIPLNFAF